MTRIGLIFTLLIAGAVPAQAQFADWQHAEESGAIEREAPDEGVDLGSGVDARRRNQSGRLWLENAFHFRSIDDGNLIGISPAIGAEYRFTPAVIAEALFGVSGAILSPDMGDSDNSFRPGNPFLGVYYTGGTGQATWIGWRVGGGAAFPVASLPEDDGTDPGGLFAAIFATLYSTGMRGGRDFWLWLPDSFGLVLPSGRLTIQNEHIEAAVELEIATLLDTGDRAPGDERDTLVLLQAIGEIGYRASPDVTLGVRLSGVNQVSGAPPDSDKFQSAADLFVRGRTDSAFLELDFTMNLDNPYGFAFDEPTTEQPFQGIWGLTLRAGAYL